ncbi:UNVERIFIED_CONTAM: hypothetical protein Scaly_2706600 [Sesamum calycinum]|uniref:Uncharacterized protein n=1 Tax=Sesamum calycinum TaxID=2727403 RepID=A0AAW2J3N6_9LAMI
MQVERCFRGAGQKEKRLLAKGSLSRPGATLGLRHGPDSHGGQQWGILDNGRKPDPAISRVKSGDLRRNAKSEGSSLGPYRRWGAKAWGANRIRYPGVAWLSSARVVRCLVKSYNERNPRFVLLRHAPKEKVFATELARLTNKIERAFLACLVKSSFGPTLAGDDDVELTAEKDSAFRRSARWCGLPVIYWRKVGMTSSPHGPYGLGHTCYNGNYNGKQGCKAERIRKDCLSSDCSLQLGNMKLESLVIADQHAAVNMYSGPVHTARHTLGIGFARSIGPMITHDFCVTLVPQRLLVGLLAHTTVGSSTGVKS